MPTREKRARALGVSVDELLDGRGRHGNQPRGSSHPRWNEGRMLSEHGYVKVRVGRSHPLADPNGYAYEHELVAVTALGRLLRDGELVHHQNEDKTDNRWENLEVTSRSDHGKHHIADRRRDAAGRLVGKKAAGRVLDGRTWDEMPARAP